MKNKQTFNKRALKRKKLSSLEEYKMDPSKRLQNVVFRPLCLLDHFRRMSLDRLENCMKFIYCYVAFKLTLLMVGQRKGRCIQNNRWFHSLG